MQHDDGYTRLYRAVPVLERRAVEDWRGKHHPSMTLEEAMAASVKVLETTVSSRQSGNTSVTISVISRRLTECEVYYYNVIRKANRWYEQVLAPSTTGIDQDMLSDS